MKKIIYVIMVLMLAFLPSMNIASSSNLNSKENNPFGIQEKDIPEDYNLPLKIFSRGYTNLFLKNNVNLDHGKIVSILNLIDELTEDKIVGLKEINRLVTALQEEFGENSIYVNHLCEVKGIGGGLLLIPFLPITPLLFAGGVILLDTNGADGHWCHLVHIAIFIPFIGLPLYMLPPPTFVIIGYAGLALGVVID